MSDIQMNMTVEMLQQEPGPPAASTSSLPLGLSEPTIEELQRELPDVHEGQVELGDVLSRVVQAIYAELSELAETMPNMSDSARKRTLADWVVKTKKQVIKLFAVVKWARDADTVQKCMNIVAFLMSQNRQFEDSIRGINYAKESLDPARLRNHDLLTSLDVLTTGSYLRLPTCIKKKVIPPAPLTDSEVQRTLTDLEGVILFRLRMTEIIPMEMSLYQISGGRVEFTAPKLFKTSLCLQGAGKEDGWFLVDVEFLFDIGGDATGLQDFPKVPTGIIKRYIADEADSRLGFYLPLPPNYVQPPGFDIPPRPQLPEGVADTPLIRLYNFLQIMSLSYQLEVLWYQAERMRTLGWANYLKVQMSSDRKAMTVSYWIRLPNVHVPGRPRVNIPLLGGKLTIAIIDAHIQAKPGSEPLRTPRSKTLARIQEKAKLCGNKPSDSVEGLKFEIKWEPEQGALGVMIRQEDSILPEEVLVIDADNLDFESTLRTILKKHASSILLAFRTSLQPGIARAVFSPPGVVTLVDEGDSQALRVHLCGDEVVIITIDPIKGRLNLRDTGDLASVGRGPRFLSISEKLNENPTILMEALFRLRLQTITELAEQKANYLGLQSYRRRNFQPEEMSKFGTSARGTLYIQLSKFPDHYLVLVITDERFRYAFITTKVLSETMYANMVMEDIAWLDVDRIHGEVISTYTEHTDLRFGAKRKPDADHENQLAKGDPNDFDIDTQVLRELYSYCCARVAYMKVERQLKLRKIPYEHVNPTSGSPMTTELAYIQSSLARSVPALCVQSRDILSGAPAAEAAMPNIRVIPLNWWSEENAQVVTCVKLKYVQQPIGRTASSSAVIRPTKRIIYDTTEAVVSFLSENVNTCVDEFLEEWARVSKMVVIAREVAQMSKEKKWSGIRLLSFDLQTVEFAYATGYAVSISCEEQLSPTGGNFILRFSRCKTSPPAEDTVKTDEFNPHDDAEPFLRNILRHGQGLAPSIRRLVGLLRDTLPIVVELEAMRQNAEREGKNLDTFAKSAGWYRLLYGNLQHAIDFRAMNGQRVAILDASHSLFNKRLLSKGNESKSRNTTTESQLGLKPIPNFQQVVSDAVKQAILSGIIKPGTIAALDVGVVCDSDAVGLLGRTIHKMVFSSLKT